MNTDKIKKTFREMMMWTAMALIFILIIPLALITVLVKLIWKVSDVLIEKLGNNKEKEI